MLIYQIVMGRMGSRHDRSRPVSSKEVLMEKTSLSFLKLAVAAVIALCVSVTSASAESLKATFTLPYEVHWGKAVLAPGPYTITFDSLSGPAIVRTSAGGGRVIVIPKTTGQAMNDQPSALIVTATESGHTVRYLNLREVNVSLGYHVFTKAERNLGRKAAGPEAVSILMARQ
jgi:hypothetical protein